MTISNDLLIAVATASLSVISSATAFVVTFFKNKKAKQELQLKNIELEKDLIEYKTAVLNNAFIICPNCKHHIKLTDVKIMSNDKKGD